MAKGKLFVISGASGVGKGTVLGIMMKKRDDLAFSVSATTRPRREGESDADYRFLTKEEFLAEAEAGAFLETTVYSGYHFGTAAAELDRVVEAGEIAVLPIDICGALTLKNRYRSGAMLVFVRRRKEAVILDIVSRALEPKDKTCRILSLDDEYRNEELCDLTLTSQGGSKAAGELAAMLGL